MRTYFPSKETGVQVKQNNFGTSLKLFCLVFSCTPYGGNMFYSVFAQI